MSYLTQDQRLARRRAAQRARVRRRRLAVCGILASVGVVLVIALPGGATRRSGVRQASATAVSSRAVNVRASPKAAREVSLTIAPPQPGRPHVFLDGSARHEIALTFDDGLCSVCAARIIHTLARTRTPASIFPNGRYSSSWAPLAPTIRRLVASGLLTIGNHTFLHHDAREESPAAFELDLASDERWIEHTFGVSARPFFRPPYGAYDASTLAVAGQLGYTKVILWSGTVADSSPHTIAYILGAIRYWARPGAIILMHANYPATSLALPQILAILHQRKLRAVTLAKLLG